MSLKQWSKRFKVFVADHNRSKIAYIVPRENGWDDLYNLSDYSVSTVGAGVVWLLKNS